MIGKTLKVALLANCSYAQESFVNFLPSVIRDLPDTIEKQINNVMFEAWRFSGMFTKHEDAFKSFEELVAQNGFVTESQQVVTDDGYILTLYRIPGTIEKPDPAGKPVVLLSHGLESTMMQWVFTNPEDAPAFNLARAGYDVWLGNNRGNNYANRHVKFDSHSWDYWNFSWEEMGTKDTPALVEAIRRATGVKKISYVAHSEGGTQILAGASLIPDFYKEAFNLCVMMAPVSTMRYSEVPVFVFLSQPVMINLLMESVKWLQNYDAWQFNF